MTFPDEQNVPLYKALSYGASSVEADIYLVDGELLVRTLHAFMCKDEYSPLAQVGHTPFDLSKTRTLASLYLDPLISLIAAANKDVVTGSQRFGIVFSMQETFGG